MRVLVLGATGMLGHKLAQVIGGELETFAAVRSAQCFPAAIPVRDVIGGVDVTQPGRIANLLKRLRPDAVLNAVGVVKQSAHQVDRSTTVAINALFPNQLAEACAARQVRLVHYSTDCVFSGSRESRRGNRGYRETDPTDAADLYGLSKLLGEPAESQALVLRTSIIGRELRARLGLVEWCLAQTAEPMRGFTQALFSGLTTLELARLTLRILIDHRSLSGLWHVAAEPISKHDLLILLRQAYGLPANVVPDPSTYCDRRLDGGLFSQATGWRAPDWPSLIGRMHDDPFPYDGSANADSVLANLAEGEA